ncbi:hypothetical protein EJ07DRAFT_125472, partial [Lizonia empirigonia]
MALSGPARRDCGQGKCYDAVNSCGMKYGGQVFTPSNHFSCWTECVDGVTNMPTFTALPCASIVESASSFDVSYPTQTSGASPISLSSTDSGTVEASITTPPFVETTAVPSPGTSLSNSCSPLWLCIDYIAVCGDLTQMYGGCYDTCTTAPPIESPPCSLSST